MKKKTAIILCTIAVLAIIGVIVCFVLAYNGLLGFYHPQKQAKEGQIKVACVGDSVTYGFGIKNWRENNYPQQLQALLGDDYCVNNFGYSGRTVQSSADRPYINERLYRQSLDFAPDIVIFMLGSNDSKAYNWGKWSLYDEQTFIQDYEALVQSYLELPSHPKVYIMAQPPVFEVNGKVKYNIEKDTIANEIVPAVRDIAEQMNLPLIDIYELFEGKPELFSDGCHPTAQGAGMIADAVYARLLADGSVGKD